VKAKITKTADFLLPTGGGENFFKKPDSQEVSVYNGTTNITQ
jgi:hypothetical protein